MYHALKQGILCFCGMGRFSETFIEVHKVAKVRFIEVSNHFWSLEAI
jgi:hypothetical protein